MNDTNFVSNLKILSKTALGGGDICTTSKVETDQGVFVLKENKNHVPGLFHQEAKGLTALRNSGCVKTPQILNVSESELWLEYISTEEPQEEFWVSLGSQLAKLHRSQVHQLGFECDNFIGASPQKNTPYLNFKSITDWIDFFWQYRIEEQLKMLSTRKPDPDIFARFRQIEGLIREKLKVADEPPCLLHGDLWMGNVLCAQNQKVYLIDPAAYFGHREADLAMTQLFGGFHYSFFETYQKSYPLKPGWPQRLKIYQLYHLLNHWNLFGEAYSEKVSKILHELSA